MQQRVSYKIGNDEIVLETGRMAKQANGSIFAQYAGTAVIATACCSSEAKEGLDFVPLTVEYNEKYYAAGRIPGGFIKRETRPKDKEILVSRLIDRPMRPLFDKRFGREIQIVPTVLSADQVNTPDVLAVVAASAAVVISDIPFGGPIAAVRVASVKGELIVNPSFDQIATCELEIIVAGTQEGITMVEGGAKGVSEELMLAAIEKAKKPIADLCQLQLKLRELAGKPKLAFAASTVQLAAKDEIRAYCFNRLKEACFVKGKMERYAAIGTVVSDAKEKFKDSLQDETHAKLFANLMDDFQYEILRGSILEKGLRVDGRGLTDIRPITCEIGVLSRTHGSALFTRGETQSLSTVTLGTVFDEQILDDIEGDRRDRFMLHYNFPPFSVGETGRLGTGRREIGHGHLARRAIEAILPSKEAFPYTIRVVSEILESNGSSSMATVCGGTLCLLHAGVPISAPVAGIAMGLITEGGKFAVLSDILGEEDHLGDMDFKVAGTAEGITAFQMDIKIAGVSSEIMKKALEQARAGRLHILGIMNAVISVPAKELSKYAPRILTMKIETDKIGALIGPGGKNIKAICEQYQVEINTENDGTVTIYGKDMEMANGAREAVKGIVNDPEVGLIYKGVVKRIMDFGAFVEILPGKEGLVHISKLATHRIARVDEVVKEGQEIPVRLLEIDKMGRLNLSYIDALDADGKELPNPTPQGRKEH
jgi:polyribonucleotide nucleotidyltransferase